MAKLSRVFQYLFGTSGAQSHFEQFGARKSLGVGNFTKDPNTIQALSAFLTGWQDAVNPTNNAPFLEDMNGLFLLIFYQLCYGLQEGVAEYNSATTYYIGSIVKKTGTTELYGSLTDNNIGNALPSQTDNAFWHYLNPASVAPGVMADFGGTSAPFGWLACDGSVYAQGSFPALFAAIGSTWNTGGEGAGNFRVPNLNRRTTVGSGGAGTGTLGNAVGNTGGEETHTLITAEIPVHSHSITDVQHQHTGNFQAAYAFGFGLAPSTNHVGGTVLQITEPAFTGITGTNNTGGGGAHNNIQPSAVVLKIIKT